MEVPPTNSPKDIAEVGVSAQAKVVSEVLLSSSNRDFNPKLPGGSRPNASLDIGASANSRRI